MNFADIFPVLCYLLLVLSSMYWLYVSLSRLLTIARKTNQYAHLEAIHAILMAIYSLLVIIVLKTTFFDM